MNIRKTIFFIWFASSLTVAGSIQIPNADFEIIGNNGTALNWIREGGEISAVRTKEGDARFGRTAFIEHTGWQSTTLVSEAVQLRVGHLYKLSGWIKTMDAYTQPEDRYPTSVAGCLSMESLPFTNHSATVGATTDWKFVEILFIATRSRDRVRIHLGYNGEATGCLQADGLRLEEVEDISEYIPLETVRWCGPAYRYDDRGWIFVHIEGEPYQRGYQYGFLVADEIAEYIDKLSISACAPDPKTGWNNSRFSADAMMLRKYEKEYLLEMRGIADGAAKAGAEAHGRSVDLIDIVTMNSIIDLGQVPSALTRTAHALSGIEDLGAAGELEKPDRLHKCSGFLANGPATPDGSIVFGQLFMWSGYTGPHFNVLCDVQPSTGHRLVYQTFPGGIHSGADFYINDSGIMIGETTTNQTPFNLDGTPQSNRIRKAMQYGSSIDQVADILIKNNNGMYTNDWLIGDAKTDETAILLLGTWKNKLWRSGKGDFPGNTAGFYFSTNNNKDLEVRKEYIPNPDNAPYDLTYRPSNRDVAFMEFYQKYKGRFDSQIGVAIWNSSPLNRPHACDGKITSSEMAGQLVFLAHYGKVTLREKFPGENGRIPDLPGAVPRLTLGYSIASPKFITDQLQRVKTIQPEIETRNKAEDCSRIGDWLLYPQDLLWHNTVYPASHKENWFVSGTAGYWNILHSLPNSSEKAADHFKTQLTELNYRLLYTISREGSMIPTDADQRYDGYKHYQIPRIRGTILLHQLRLYVGNERFSKIMNTLHSQYREKPVRTDRLLAEIERLAERPLNKILLQWLEREDLPDPRVMARTSPVSGGWELEITADEEKYQYMTTTAIETENQILWIPMEIHPGTNHRRVELKEKPIRIRFNALNDVPIQRRFFYTFGNYFDDYLNVQIAYGTARQIEANHTMALRFAVALADRFAEIIPPVRKDSEISAEEMKSGDWILLGQIGDNTLVQTLAEEYGLKLYHNWFQWQGVSYTRPEDGLIVVLPNPANPRRVIYLITGNSAMQIYQMTKRVIQPQAWAVMKGENIVTQGYHEEERMVVIPSVQAE